MSRDPGPSEPRRGRSCKIGRDPSEDGSVPAPLPRRCALRRATHGCTTRPTRPPKPLGSRPDVARSRPFRAMARGILQNKARSGRIRVGTRPSPTSVRFIRRGAGRHTAAQPDPLGPRNRLDLDRMSRDPGPPEPQRGGSSKIRRDPSEDGSKPALLPRRCALRRATHGCTTRPTRPPKPLGSRPDVARSRPSRATARGILQNKARSERRRVGTRPSPTCSVRAGRHTAAQPDPLDPRLRSDLDRMSRDPNPPEPRRGGSCKIRRDPSEDGSKPTLLPRRCALRRPSYRRTTRPTRPPSSLGSRPDVARSKPSRATARGILQNKARSERRRVETRPSPTSVRYIRRPSYRRATRPPRPPKPLGSRPDVAISTPPPSHGEEDPAK